MIIQSLDIIEFITHPELLNDQSLSVAQQTFLKATYGLALNFEEQEIFERATGRTESVFAEQNEATLIAGRRAGKNSKIAAPIALYEAFRDHNLSRGDRGYVMLIAPAMYQAEIAMRFIREVQHADGNASRMSEPIPVIESAGRRRWIAVVAVAVGVVAVAIAYFAGTRRRYRPAPPPSASAASEATAAPALPDQSNLTPANSTPEPQ